MNLEKASAALYEAQEKMPPGQNWNLHSKSACDTLAKRVLDSLGIDPNGEYPPPDNISQ